MVIDYNISPSLLKDFYGTFILNEGCKNKFVLVKLLKISEIDDGSYTAAELGRRFEYIATGALPRDGVVPRPALTDTGRESKTENDRIERQAEKFNAWLSDNGFTDVEVGVEFKKNEPFGRKCIVDVMGYTDKITTYSDETEVEYVMPQGLAVVDLKYTALADDKWTAWGWKNPKAMDIYKIQSLESIAILRLMGIPIDTFVFAVFSNKKDESFEVFVHQPTEEDMAEHERFVMAAKAEIDILAATAELGAPRKKGFWCGNCPDLRCKLRDLPKINRIK